MQYATKIQLSKEETELVNNTKWILTKHRIIKKVYTLFGEINDMMRNELINHNYLFADNMKYRGGKISKGENYQFLPYLILDQPSFFGKNNIFTVRTMFWWGNFFSVTLHLSGVYKTKFISSNPALLTFLQKNNFSICINKEEWQHHFEETNYVHTEIISPTKFDAILTKDFFKVTKKLSLTQWDDACNFIMESFREILELLEINFRAGKKDLLPEFPITGSGL